MVQPEPEVSAKVTTVKEDVQTEPTTTEGLDLKAFEGMLASIMGLVKQNAEQIANLQGKLGDSKDDAESAQIVAELEESRAKEKAFKRLG